MCAIPEKHFGHLLRVIQTTPVAEMESKLCREFGPALQSALVNSLSQPLRKFDSEIFPENLRDFERFMFRFGPPDEKWYRYQGGDFLSKVFDFRREILESSPAFAAARERLMAAGGVIFSTRIAGYSSLNLELATGSFDKLAKVFDGHFDELRVFLDAFVPSAFADVFNENFADRHAFEVSIPQSVEDAFVAAAKELNAQSAQSDPRSNVPPSVSTATRERAEWLWRLANGSLLVPFAIALVVMFYGIRMLSDIRRTEDEALRPILVHQLELLREDRARFSPSLPKDTSACAVTTNAKPANSGN